MECRVTKMYRPSYRAKLHYLMLAHLVFIATSTVADNPRYFMYNNGNADISARQGSITSHSGYISGDDYPNNYDATATFINLPADRDTTINLRFETFELEGRGWINKQCDDYLLMSNYKYCDEELKGKTRSYAIRARSFRLTFHTDWRLRDTGFRVWFTVAIEPQSTITPKPTAAVSAITHNQTVSQTVSLGTRTLTSTGTTNVISDVSSSNNSATPNASNMQGPLDNIELIGIIGAVTALVLICIVIVTVLVTRHKKKQRYQDGIADTQNNHTEDTLPLSTINGQKSVTGNTGENGVYILAEEITSGVPDTNSSNAGPSSQHISPVYDLADEYQLAGPTGDQYANFESVLGNEAEMNMTDTYPAVTSATKTKLTQPAASPMGLVDNDLYGT